MGAVFLSIRDRPKFLFMSEAELLAAGVRMAVTADSFGFAAETDGAAGVVGLAGAGVIVRVSGLALAAGFDGAAEGRIAVTADLLFCGLAAETEGAVGLAGAGVIVRVSGRELAVDFDGAALGRIVVTADLLFCGLGAETEGVAGLAERVTVTLLLSEERELDGAIVFGAALTDFGAEEELRPLKLCDCTLGRMVRDGAGTLGRVVGRLAVEEERETEGLEKDCCLGAAEGELGRA